MSLRQKSSHLLNKLFCDKLKELAQLHYDSMKIEEIPSEKKSATSGII